MAILTHILAVKFAKRQFDKTHMYQKHELVSHTACTAYSEHVGIGPGLNRTYGMERT